MANVIKTVLTYPLDGSTRDFNIPFEYLARKFVVVTLIGVDRKVLTLNTDYRFATRTTISLTKSWGTSDGYTNIELRRVTSTTDRLVDFTDGSILRAYDLNVAQIQTMHVAEEARDLTADTIGVNNDGHLDARGRRIVNLANAVDDRDAVPFGQLRAMNQNSWQARNEAQGFRNEAQNFRNQAETFKNNAAASASSSAQSASESAGSASAAKVSESNASNSKNAAAASQSAAATSERNAKTSETNAKSSETNAKTSESKAKESEELVIRNIESYGSLPIGSVIATPVNKAPAGFLRMDGSTFNEATYQALFLYLGTNKLPDWRGRYLKGALNDGEVGVLKGWGIPAHSGSTTADGEHNHTGTTSSAGNHNHTGTTSSGGAHRHNLITGRNDTGAYHAQGGDRGHVGNGYTAKYDAGTSWIGEAGNHTHTMTTNTTGNHTHTMTTNTVGHHQHTVNIPAQGTGVMDVDHVKVYWWIKAFGTTDAEQMAQVSKELENIRTAVNTANDAKMTVETFKGQFDTKVGVLEGQLDTLSAKVGVLETHDSYEWMNHDDPRVTEYLDWTGTTQSSSNELMVKITDNTIYIHGIIRPTVAPKKDVFKVNKPLPGTTRMVSSFVPVLVNAAAAPNVFASTYINRMDTSTFPAQATTPYELSIAWYMISLMILRFV